MPKFYFTYGSDERFPYQYGWTEVEAPDMKAACMLFRLYHPDRSPDRHVLNCAYVYTEEKFRKGMADWSRANRKDPRERCHERITLTRDVNLVG